MARGRTGNRAFTLIEILVVIAIIGILAAIIIPMAHIAGKTARINLAKAQLSQIETALAQYKDKRGVYPPDNPANPALNQLFYELTGSVYRETLTPATLFRRIHGGESISQAAVSNVFNVGGFINSSLVANPLDTVQLQQAEVRDFFSELKPKQYLEIVNKPGDPVTAVLGLVDVDGPVMYSSPTSGKKINPWRYVSSNPVNSGPGSYDLWVEITVSGKTYRISNWSQEAKPLN